MGDATHAMANRYGFSVLDATWEMYGQSRDGAVVAQRLGEGTDFGAIEDNLRSLGYDEPAAADGVVWSGSNDLVTALDLLLTPVMQSVALLPDERTVLLSDHPEYASASVDVLDGSADSLVAVAGDVAPLAGVA